jgi:hypothetical protein
MRSTLSALGSGTLFGGGLAAAQMTNPAKVLSFLDVAGDFDPSLGLVMGAALGVSVIGVRLARRTPSTPASIDARLLVGATCFGVGWGLAGFCPGPAVASLVSGSREVMLFVVSMLAGMAIFRVLQLVEVTRVAAGAAMPERGAG